MKDPKFKIGDTAWRVSNNKLVVDKISGILLRPQGYVYWFENITTTSLYWSDFIKESLVFSSKEAYIATL